MRPAARYTLGCAATAVLTALSVPGGLTAQIAQRVAAVEDGTVRFAYDLEPGVEICERGIRTGESRVAWRGDSRYAWTNCVTDVAEVDLEIRGGLVRDVEVVRPGEERPADLRADLGPVPATEAADYLLGLAYEGATADGAEEAIFPATIADVPDTWRGLLDVARDRSVHRGVRKNALFWVGQEAADAATAELSGVALAEDEDQEVREAAIFALSQRPENQAITALMEVARSAEQADSRRTAMFWLAQSEDDRVVGFFEDILLGRNR